jgi:hypothetical protein
MQKTWKRLFFAYLAEQDLRMSLLNWIKAAPLSRHLFHKMVEFQAFPSLYQAEKIIVWLKQLKRSLNLQQVNKITRLMHPKLKMKSLATKKLLIHYSLTLQI